MSPLWMLLGIALAGVDAHGPIPPPSDGDPARPLRVLGGERLQDGAVGALGEYAREPVNLFLQDGPEGEIRSVAQLDDVGLVNLQIAQGFGRLGLGLVIPVAPLVTGDSGGGPALVDPLLIVPLCLADGSWGGVTLAPSLRIPVGAHGRFLGSGALSGGLTAASTLAVSGFRTSLEVGADLARPAELDGLEYGGSTLKAGGALGWFFEQAGIGTHLELVGSTGLLPSNTGSTPVEATATVRGAHGRGWWALGGGTGLTQGIGSPALRVFAGGGLRWSKVEAVQPVVEIADDLPIEPPAVGLTAVSVDVRDVRGEPIVGMVRFEGPGAEPTEIEILQGRARASLAPGPWTAVLRAEGFGEQRRELVVGGEAVDVQAILLDDAGDAELSLTVRDVEGRAAPGARVLIDGLPVGTVGQEQLVVADLAAGDHTLSVRGHGYLGWTRSVQTGERAEVLLHPVDGTLRVVVTDPEGSAIPDAWVAFSGPARRPAVPLEGDTERVFVLSTGSWTALVSSESHGVQARDVLLEDDAWTTTEARFVLGGPAAGPADLRVRVVDIDGQPVEGARIRLGDAELGETATGGDLLVSGVAVGAQDLHLELEGAAPAEPQEILLRPGLQEAWFTVGWLPGTLRLRVRHPDGPVSDAVVVAAGPEARAPMALGPTGGATWQMAPGEWELLVTSAQWGTASRELVIPASGGSLTRMEVVLLPVGNAAGAGRLNLAVQDAAGEPVLGAQVEVDGRGVGTTTSGGFAAPLTPGDRAVGVRSRGFAAWERTARIRPGPNELRAELAWDGMLRLKVLDPKGQPARDATVRLAGAGALSAPIPMGPDGVRELPAAAGTWQAVVVSAEHGLAASTFEIPAGTALYEATVRLEAGGGAQLYVEVRDQIDRPVPGAVVSCEGCDPVRAVQGVAVMGAIPEGVRELSISAPNHRASTLAIEPGATDARIAVVKALPVNLEIEVVGPRGEPVQATVRFVGPVAVPAARTSASGAMQVSLIPGPWVVTAEGEGFGVRRRDITIEPGARDLRVDFALSEARVSVQGTAVSFVERVHFDLNSAVLQPDSEAILREVADTLVGHPELTVVEVQGHSDATGDLALNQQLSEDRAEAVRAALVRLGVAESRLVARGFGPTQPLESNQTDEGRQRNRRVQFAILESAVQ